MEYVRTLKAIHRADKDLVGERAADLALLEQKDFVVPLSFVLANDAFESFITNNKLQERIGEALGDPDTNRSYDKVRELLLTGTFPKEMVAEIVEAYESLDVRPEDSLNDIVEAGEAPFVSVMLSPNHAVPTESSEGIILNVKGLEELLIAIKECWACLFTPTMQRHRKAAGIPNKNLNTGIIVQHMPRGDISAEAWSAAGSDTQHLMVKTYYGALDIGGDVEKDEFKLTREYLKPILASVTVQTTMLARNEEGRLDKVPIGARGEEQKLNDKIVIELGRLAKKASQAIDGHVMLQYNVDGETVKTLLCTRLLLTKGSIKLQGYAAEERIEDEALPEAGEHVEVTSETTTVAVDEETGEEEVVEEEHAVVSEEALDQEAIDVVEEAVEPRETVEETEPVEDESIEPSGTEEEPATEETQESEDETPETLEEEPVAEETSEPETPEEPTPPAEEPVYETPEPVEEPTPEPVEEPEEESIFAGVEQEVEEAVEAEETAETPEPEESTFEEAVEEPQEELEEAPLIEEDPEEEPIVEQVEPVEEPQNEIHEEPTEEPEQDIEEQPVTEETPEEYETPVEPEETEPVEEESIEPSGTEEEPSTEETPEPVAEETLEQEETSEEEPTEAPEPVEEETPEPEGERTEVEKEETIVEVDEETGEEELVSDDREGAVVEGETPATIDKTLDEAYSLVKGALTERYEKRFKNNPPTNMKDMFFELSSEVIIPHEEDIGELVTTVEDAKEYDKEFEQRIASILDDFLEQIK